MNFNQLLDAVRENPEALSIPPSWAQGRAGFGGLMAAMVYERMRLKLADDRPVRSLAISFVSPAAADVPIRFEVEVLREGKAVSTLLGRAIQNGQVVTLVQGNFGAGRPSVINVAAAPAVATLHHGRHSGVHAPCCVALDGRRPAVQWQPVAPHGRLGAPARCC